MDTGTVINIARQTVWIIVKSCKNPNAKIFCTSAPFLNNIKNINPPNSRKIQINKTNA